MLAMLGFFYIKLLCHRSYNNSIHNCADITKCYYMHMHAMYILITETTGYGTSSIATSTTWHNTLTTGISRRNTPSAATSGSNTSTTSATTTASGSASSHRGANKRKGKPCVVLTSLTMNQSVDIIILRIHLQLAK